MQLVHPFLKPLSRHLSFWCGTCVLALLLGGCSLGGILQNNGQITTPSTQDEAPPPDAAPMVPVIPAPPSSSMAPAPAAATTPISMKAKVALLVPLSGKSASLGQAMANAAQLAVFDVGGERFELMPRDTKGTPSGATTAARTAIAEGAGLLIGPLFAADVAAVKPMLPAGTLSMLALSTDISLAQRGAYVMGFAPKPQVERVIAYAAAQGLRRFAAILPSGAYGQLVRTAFENAVRENKGVIVSMVDQAQISSLAPYRNEIDAVFVPLGGTGLRTACTQLAATGFERGAIRLLGTGLWDEPAIAEGIALLDGGWFAAPEPSAREPFITKYKETYGAVPPRLATLAYDATALAAVLARNGKTYDEASLTSPSGFAGLDGVFRLGQDGQIERGLAVLELTRDGQTVIDHAPTVFLAR